MTSAVPRGWVATTLGEIRRNAASRAVPSDMPDEALELWSVPSFETGKPEHRRGSEIGSDKQTVIPGTVLVCKINPRINRVWVVGPDAGRRQIASTEWIPFFPVDGIEPRYLCYFLRQNALREHLASNVSGVGGSLMRVRPAVVERFPLLLPPTNEQHRIVAAIEQHLSRLDAAVAGLKRVQAQLPRYRAAVLKMAVEGRLTSEVAANVDSRSAEAAIPDGWLWITVEQCAAKEPRSITDGPFGSNLKTEHYTQAGPRVVRLQNIGDGEFIDAVSRISNERYEALAKHAVFPRDLIIAALGNNPPRACIMPDGIGRAIVKADCIRFKPDLQIASPDYLNIALNAEPTRARVTKALHGVGRPRLNLSEIRSITLPVPGLAAQAAIVAEVDRRLSLARAGAAAIQAALLRAAALRQAVLRRAFSGQLVPQDPNDEAASVLLERIRAERQSPAARRPPRRRGTKSSTPS